MPATLAQLGTYVGLYAAFVAGIHVVDGPWKSWSKGTSIDPWTATHVLWGYLGAYMNQSFSQQMALASANEILEFFLRKTRPDLVWGTGEPCLNVPFDLAGNALGWKLGALQKRG